MRIACNKHFPSVELGEVSEIVSGGTPSTDNPTYWDGDIVWVTPKDLGKPRSIDINSSERLITSEGLASSSARLLPVGTVLLSSRAPIGHLGIAAVPLATNQGFKNLICSHVLYNRYLFHILRGSIEDIAAEGRGNTFLEIPGKVVRALRIPLPPIEIQKSASAFLDAVYLVIAGQKVDIPAPLPPLTDQHRLALLIQKVAKQILDARTLRQQAAAEAEVFWRATLAAAFSSNVTECPLQEVCAAIIDNLHSNPRYADTGVPCVRSPDVGWGTLNLETALKTDEIEYRHRTVRGEPQADDIVLVREGGGTGKAALVAPGQRFSLGQRVMMLRPKKEIVLPKFFLYQLLSPLIQDDHIAPLSKGSAAPHLNIGSLRKFPFRIPSLHDQRRIVGKLDELRTEVDALKRLQAQTDVEISALMPSVLSKAFAGEL